jgi:hypothetical protein
MELHCVFPRYVRDPVGPPPCPPQLCVGVEPGGLPGGRPYGKEAMQALVKRSPVWWADDATTPYPIRDHKS